MFLSHISVSVPLSPSLCLSLESVKDKKFKDKETEAWEGQTCQVSRQARE